MPIILDNKVHDKAFHLKRMIHCPGNWLVPPSVDVYKREPVSLLKNVSDFIELKGKRIKIRKERIVKDGLGRKVLDWKKIYELTRKGVVLYPQVSAAWAIEHVYDPLSPLCQECDKRCKEGMGTITERSIRRLIGEPMKR